MTAAQKKAAQNRIVNAALWGIAHEPQIHYSMGANRDDWLTEVKRRPGRAIPSLPLWTDCSGFVTMCYWIAKVDDPSGFNYRVLGYTGTLLAHCQHITGDQVQIGDLIVYGPGTGHHTVVVIDNAQDGSLIVASHGEERGPVRILNYLEAAEQPHPITFLRSPQLS
jgi:hypothetical protein